MAYETSITNETGGEGLIATVEVVMTRDIVTINLDDSLCRVQDIFVREGFHHLLVVEEDVYRMKPLSAVSGVDKDDGFSQIRFCSPAASYLF